MFLNFIFYFKFLFSYFKNKRHQIWIEIIHAILRLCEAIIKQIVYVASQCNIKVKTLNTDIFSTHGITVKAEESRDEQVLLKGSDFSVKNGSEVGRKEICFNVRNIAQKCDNFKKFCVSGAISKAVWFQMMAKIFALWKGSSGKFHCLPDLYFAWRKPSSETFQNICKKRISRWMTLFKSYLSWDSIPPELYVNILDETAKHFLVFSTLCEHDVPPMDGNKEELERNPYYEEIKKRFEKYGKVSKEDKLTLDLLGIWEELGGTRLIREEQFGLLYLYFLEGCCLAHFALTCTTPDYLHVSGHFVQLVLVFGAAINFSSSILENYIGVHKVIFFFLKKNNFKKN